MSEPALGGSRLLYSTKAMGCGFFIFFQQSELTAAPSAGAGSGASSSAEHIEEPYPEDDVFVEVDNRLLDEHDISDIISLLELSGLVE